MTYNTPVRLLQQGSVEEVAASGTLLVSTGGSIQVASGGVLNIASGGSLTGNGVNLTAPVVSNITIGGTLGRWSFGTSALASGVGTVATGLARVYSANANAILGEAQGAGSAAHVMIDLSLAGAGSVIYRLGSVGGGVWAAGGTIAWQALGT